MKKLSIIEYVFEIVLIIILSFVYYLAQPIKTSKVVFIPQGGINKIITYLHNKKGYNVSKIDSIILRFLGKPQSGWVEIGSTEILRADFLYKLTTAKAALQKVTLIPGETTVVFLYQLSKKLNLDFKKLVYYYNKYAPMPEGVLVPETYSIPLGIGEKELIKILLNNSKKERLAFSNKIFGTYDEKKWFRYVAVASIIQKESANNKEMPIVSSVIYNRLKKGMKLQMDGTLNYGKYSHIKVTAKRIREDKSFYNTYLHKGIPKYPVCTVSFEAIKAAIFPKKTNYLYFVKGKNGTHKFSCNYSTHLHNIDYATK